MALREKQSQGELVGSLPWGYVKDASGSVTADPDVAPLIARAFELYSTGDYSDRSLAEWLNSNGLRTARNALVTKDAVRDLLKYQAYAGFVGGRRDMSKSIPGNHPAIVSEDLFEKVQTIRSAKTNTLHPGRPSS